MCKNNTGIRSQVFLNLKIVHKLFEKFDIELEQIHVLQKGLMDFITVDLSFWWIKFPGSQYLISF